jgi:hypothetical protein
MNSHVVAAIIACATCACGASTPPATAATATAAPTPTSAPTPTAEPAPAPAPAPIPDVVVTPVTTVSNEITTPNVVSPDKVIWSLRPKFNTCYENGLKKDPKLEGSVTLSAKIDRDGKVSAVTPKLVTGLNDAVVKCLADQLKAASFAAAGGMNYTTSLDIPVGFSSR